MKICAESLDTVTGEGCDKCGEMFCEECKVQHLEECKNRDDDDDNWVFTIGNEDAKSEVSAVNEESVMIDSGAVTHVAPKSFMPTADTIPAKDTDPRLRVTNGVVLKNYGSRSVEFVAAGENKRGAKTEVSGKALFCLRDVKHPIFSVPELCDKGNKVVFQESGGYIENMIDHR